MNELIQQAGNILSQASEFLKHPEVKGAVSGFLSWISSKLFAKKKATQEKLKLIEKQKVDEEIILELKANLKFVLEGNEELQKELAKKVNDVEKLLKQEGVQIKKTNTAKITGNDNKTYQDINNSTITDNSINQNHSGTGDNIGRDKITGE